MNQNRSIDLIATNLDGTRHAFRLAPNQGVFVGKSGNCGLRLTHDEISEIHCRIGFEDGELWAQDWMSNSGTLLNGQPLTAKSQLSADSLLELGPFTIEIKEVRTHESVEPKNESQIAKPAACSIAKFTHLARSEDQATDELPDSVLASATAASCPSHDASAVDEMETDYEQPFQDESADLTWHGDDSLSKSHEYESSNSATQDSDELDYAAEDDDNYAEAMADFDNEPSSADSFEGGLDFFDDDELAENAVECDSETIALLQAEIEDLRAALAHRDVGLSGFDDAPAAADETESSSQVLQRLQELAEEANRAEERVLILEEMLQAAEETNRAEAEERTHLEAWVGDIERRIGQREQEHAAELAALKNRLSTADHRQRHLRQQLEQAAKSDGESQTQQLQSELELLQRENQALQASLDDARKELQQLSHQLESQADQNETTLRSERAKIAKEQAEVSRLKFEYAQKLDELSKTIPKAELDPRLQSLREQRQEIRELNSQRAEQSAENSLSSRLKKLWSLVE